MKYHGVSGGRQDGLQGGEGEVVVVELLQRHRHQVVVAQQELAAEQLEMIGLDGGQFAPQVAGGLTRRLLRGFAIGRSARACGQLRAQHAFCRRAQQAARRSQHGQPGGPQRPLVHARLGAAEVVHLRPRRLAAAPAERLGLPGSVLLAYI